MKKVEAEAKAWRHEGDSLPAGSADGTGFHVRLKPKRGASADESDAFELRFQAYLKRHQLDFSGGPLRAWLSGHGRDLAPENCMDFLGWIHHDGTIVHVATSGIRVAQSELPPLDFNISISIGDPALQAVLTLYGTHRLSARQALAALNVAAPFQSSAAAEPVP